MSISHIRARAKERYGLELTAVEIRFILKMIGTGQCQRIEVMCNNRSQAWRINWHGVPIVFVTMQREDGRYIARTILPEHTVKKHGFSVGEIMIGKRRREK